MKAKKYLGQHFLIDNNIANKIVNSLTLVNQTKKINCLEVGAGKGILTKLLLKKTEYDLYVVEIDDEAIDYLNIHIPEIKNKLFHKDFLKFEIQQKFKHPLILIGNLPYNITAPIFFKVIENKDLISEIVVMIQKEVAVRISSKHGTKKYGILSVLLQAYYDIEYLFTVSNTVFDPPPKVQSAVIRLKRKDTEFDIKNFEHFKQVVKLTFGQRRKMLRNTLKAKFDISKIKPTILTKRPEQLSVQEFVDLANLIYLPAIN